ncbi:SDR family NAD(P)-dependent oxidoreductase [Dactylosporangium salmoneum]|uniref:SDR family oxidoreductase n=1 Tax=Dactylosporangium salmoneum TaxID=53361 RepID=A0ABN3HHV1_9ACTN
MTTKTALVTGGNKGIGLEIARGLRDVGFEVLLGARDPIRGKEAAEAIGATAVPLDVTDEDSIARLAEGIEVLDVLVNNAGILLERGAPPSGIPVQMLRDTFAVNVFGVVAVTNALLPALRRAPAARIVNLGSGLGSLAYAADAEHVYARNPLLAYNSSKSALSAVTLAYANELRGTSIKVNVADPGYCATDLNGHAGPRTPGQGAVAAIRLATLPDDGPTGGFFDEEGAVPF